MDQCLNSSPGVKPNSPLNAAMKADVESYPQDNAAPGILGIGSVGAARLAAGQAALGSLWRRALAKSMKREYAEARARLAI